VTEKVVLLANSMELHLAMLMVDKMVGDLGSLLGPQKDYKKDEWLDGVTAEMLGRSTVKKLVH
jgi:hypothetical protein